jgi:hypothetical protein
MYSTLLHRMIFSIGHTYMRTYYIRRIEDIHNCISDFHLLKVEHTYMYFYIKILMSIV